MYSCISVTNFQQLNYLVSMILKRDQLQKWSRRLNDICKTKRLWRTLCHLALWLVHTGSRLKESGRHLQRNEKHWQMPLLSCWQRNFANKLIWCVIISLMWTLLRNSLYNSADKAIYIVYIREGGRNGALGCYTFIIIAASLPREWGQKFYFSKTVGQAPPVLPLPKNSNPSPLCPLSYAVFLSLLCFPSDASISTTRGRNCHPFAACVQSMSMFSPHFSFGKSGALNEYFKSKLNCLYKWQQ